jgi:hypothetical protein
MADASHPPRDRGLLVAGTLVALGTIALFAMLAAWSLSIRLPVHAEQESFPAWYTDPFDTSWQVTLEPAPGSPIGASAGRPVRVCGVVGEQAYLASLLCESDPLTPPFADPFSVMDATRETTQRAFRARAIDRYEVPCPAGVVDVFLSPYHCGEGETGEAPAGFVPRFAAGAS